jgi:hypothetical protein
MGCQFLRCVDRPTPTDHPLSFYRHLRSIVGIGEELLEFVICGDRLVQILLTDSKPWVTISAGQLMSFD